ncbi:MAG: DEAD/DEAH box helicase [Opitutia bacterium]
MRSERSVLCWKVAMADQRLILPDLWQQEALRALRQGEDVVVQAPTGAGKTYIFELLMRHGHRGQAVYAVPTRALANDKLAEWRALGWDVGIATGDVSENLGAPVVVATLETQRHRFLAGRRPDLQSSTNTRCSRMSGGGRLTRRSWPWLPRRPGSCCSAAASPTPRRSPIGCVTLVAR